MIAAVVSAARVSGTALARLLPDGSAAPGAAYAVLATALGRLVVDGRIPVGTRLPSERDLAAALGRSRATVTAAYDQLRADGLLDSRTGAGSFVRVPAGARPRTAAGWHVGPAAADPIDLSMAMFPGAPAALADAAVAAADDLGPHLHDIGYEPAGLPELRAAIARRFERRGLPTRPDQILVTNGSLHALDLVLRLLLSPGDHVLTEVPNYPAALAAITQNGGRVAAAPIEAEAAWLGEQWDSVLRHRAPRLAYLTPDFHNPTGALATDAERRELLRRTRRTGTAVVVDETFVELGFDVDPPAPTATHDAGVITLGSLSKSVWGGLRIGWVRAATDMVNRLAALRSTIDIGGPVLEQLLAARLLASLDEIAAERRAELRGNCAALRDALADELPGWRSVAPRGGLGLWVELDAPLATPLAALAERSGVILVPGPRFGLDGSFERFLRLPFTQPVPRLQEAVARLGAAWRELGSGTGRPGPLVVA